MTGYIYKIINTINDKVYIGQTIYTLSDRWSKHLYIYRENKYDYALYRAMKKYNIKNFSIHLVEELKNCNKEILNNREIYWIEHYHSYSNGYNETIGGEGNLIYNHDEIADCIKQGKTYKEIKKY